MNKLLLIIKREFIAKVRNKSFIVMTFLSPLLFVAIGVFVGYLSTMKADLKTIAIHDETGRFVKEFKNDKEHKYVDLSQVDLKILKDSIVKESYEGLLVIPNETNNTLLQKKIEYISNDSPGIGFVDGMEEVIAKKITNENFKQVGLDTLKINTAKADVSINLKKASGEKTMTRSAPKLPSKPKTAANSIFRTHCFTRANCRKSTTWPPWWRARAACASCRLG